MNNNSFSWQRVKLVGYYYYPTLRWQIILYPILGILLTAATNMLSRVDGLILMTTLPSMIASMAVMFGPLLFIRSSDRIYESMLPATVSEKTVFIVGYCLLFIPLSILGLGWLTDLTLNAILGTPEFIAEAYSQAVAVGVDPNSINVIMGNIANLTSPATCMFAMIALRNKRWLAGLWAIVPSIVVAIITTTVTTTWLVSNIDMTDSNSITVVQSSLSEIMPTMMLVTGILSMIWIVIMVWLTHRKLRTIQL